MDLKIHSIYPGVALVVAGDQSALFGAPAAAFKATKSYCKQHDIPFPKALVAPKQLLSNHTSQYTPEFFVYDFLFVYGAAFRPELAKDRLNLVLGQKQAAASLDALRMTLTGPTLEEMLGYRDEDGTKSIPEKDARFLATISDYLAIKDGNKIRHVDTIVEPLLFDEAEEITIFSGELRIHRSGATSFELGYRGENYDIDLRLPKDVTPFSLLPPASYPQHPHTLALKAIGVRSGFDLSGPCTGFLIWINGKMVTYDGPDGMRYLLGQQGLTLDDIDSVILSHCHEDHFGAFIELIGSGRRPRVFTSEPIYRSALVKLSATFDKPKEEVAKYFDYHRVEHNQTVNVLGAELTFFYTLHSIPTLGLKVSMRDETNQKHTIVISGDTLDRESIDKLASEDIIPNDYINGMKHLIPEEKVERTLFLHDVGEAIIHGHPKDHASNPNQVVYYHCPDNEYTRSFGKEIAQPGRTFVMLEPRKVHPIVPQRVITALNHLHPVESQWLSPLLFAGRMRHVNRGYQIKNAEAHLFTVIIGGTAHISVPEGLCNDLIGPGNSFGQESMLPSLTEHYDLTAQTPMEIFEIPTEVLRDEILRYKLEPRITRLRSHRDILSQTLLGEILQPFELNQLADVLRSQTLSSGDSWSFPIQDPAHLFVIESGNCEITTNEDFSFQLGPTTTDLRPIIPTGHFIFGSQPVIKLQSSTPTLFWVLKGDLLDTICLQNLELKLQLTSAIEQLAHPKN
ncbi:MAG: MBL fold metallo-hydrolase [Myxococcota bacterium]|nr:MBL fold metallo-hydrolase [Myxococcota bacterium]